MTTEVIKKTVHLQDFANTLIKTLGGKRDGKGPLTTQDRVYIRGQVNNNAWSIAQRPVEAGEEMYSGRDMSEKYIVELTDCLISRASNPKTAPKYSALGITDRVLTVTQEKVLNSKNRHRSAWPVGPAEQPSFLDLQQDLDRHQ